MPTRTYEPTVPRFQIPGAGTTYRPTTPRPVMALARLVAVLAFVGAALALAWSAHVVAEHADRVAPGCGVSCVPAMWNAPTS